MVLFGVGLFMPAPVLAVALTQAMPLLVGSKINGVEGPVIDILKQGEAYWISLEDIARLSGLNVELNKDYAQFSTPIGKAVLAATELGLYEGNQYISETQLIDVLNIKLDFDQADYAVLFLVPWAPNGSEPARENRGLQPDILAPDTSFSFLRSYSSLTQTKNKRDNTERQYWDSTVDAGGRVAGGTWLLGLEGRQDKDVYLNRYFWNRVFDRNALRVGTQYVNQNSLLDGYDYTGAQWAYNNKNIENYTDFSSNLNFDSFLAEDITTRRTISRQDGPAGGIAELRINGRPVSRVRITLDGFYEFRDIFQAQGGYQSVQVFLYRISVREQPVDVIDYTHSELNQMLSGQELMLRGGLGERGNPADSSRSLGDETGFFQARYGVSDALTLVAVAQKSRDDQHQLLLGARMSLGRYWAVSADTAQRSTEQNAAQAYQLEIRGAAPSWEVDMRGKYYQQGYWNNPDQVDHDMILRAYHLLGPTFRLGLFGRDQIETAREDTRYLKPGFSWYPTRSKLRFSASAIPNIDGDYRSTLQMYFTYKTDMVLTDEGDLFTALFEHDPSLSQTWQFGYDMRHDIDDERIFVQYNWHPIESNLNRFEVGVSSNQNDQGYYLSWNRLFTPGIELRVSYQNGYRLFDRDAQGEQFALSLRVDLANTRRGLVPTDNSLMNLSRGAMAGRVVNQNGDKIDIGPAALRVNGSSLPQLEANGQFSVKDMRPGVYSVELSEENLPIEYELVKRSYNVEVAGSATTLVDFEVIAKYGVSGQITQLGQIVEGAHVEARNSLGDVVATGVSDQFGYYRMVGVPPGRYTLHVTRIDGFPNLVFATTLSIVIEEDYIFDQNIHLRQFKLQSFKFDLSPELISLSDSTQNLSISSISY